MESWKVLNQKYVPKYIWILTIEKSGMVMSKVNFLSFEFMWISAHLSHIGLLGGTLTVLKCLKHYF